MEIKVTTSMLPDLLASSALLTLAIYHLMIYWGRRKDVDEGYNLFFSMFVLSATVFIVLPYSQSSFKIPSRFKEVFPVHICYTAIVFPVDAYGKLYWT